MRDDKTANSWGFIRLHNPCLNSKKNADKQHRKKDSKWKQIENITTSEATAHFTNLEN